MDRPGAPRFHDDPHHARSVMNRVGGLSALVCAAACLPPPVMSAGNAAGERDFDFNVGVWKTHVSRLAQPLSGSQQRLEYDGVSVVNEVWNGRASIIELDVRGPAGHIEGMGLRLFNPQSQQWNLNWASSADGALNPPMMGE